MRFEMNGYEIELKAKYVSEWAPRKMNRQDAMNVLNQICIWAREAAEWEALQGFPALSKKSKESAGTIYEFLESKGAFKDL